MTGDVAIPPNWAQLPIDDELLSLEKWTLQLRTERNAYAETLRFPEGILGSIPTILADSSPLNSWFKINLVCWHWRGIALGTVALWTNPSTHRHDLALFMLERSKPTNFLHTFNHRNFADHHGHCPKAHSAHPLVVYRNQYRSYEGCYCGTQKLAPQRLPLEKARYSTAIRRFSANRRANLFKHFPTI